MINGINLDITNYLFDTLINTGKQNISNTANRLFWSPVECRCIFSNCIDNQFWWTTHLIKSHALSYQDERPTNQIFLSNKIDENK